MSFHRVSFVLLVVVASSLCFSATLVVAALPENDAAVSTVAVDEVIFPESDMVVQPSTDTFSDFESEDFEESEDPLLEPNDQQATTSSTQQNNNNKDGGDKLMSVSHKHHKMHSRSHKMAENLDYDPQEEGEGDEDELHEHHHHHHRHHHHFLHKHCCFGVAAVIFLVAFLIRRKKQLAQRSLNMVDNASSVEVVCCEGVPAEKSVAFQV